MEKIVLNFFGEEISIVAPKDLGALRNRISQLFFLSQQDSAELVLIYEKDFQKKVIQSEEDYKTFLRSSVSFINLEISSTSKIYQENLNKLQEEEKKDKEILDDLIKKNEKVEEELKNKFVAENKKVNELNKKIVEIKKERTKILCSICQEKRKLLKEKRDNYKKIVELQKKLGLPIADNKNEKKDKKCCKDKIKCQPIQMRKGVFIPPFCKIVPKPKVGCIRFKIGPQYLRNGFFGKLVNKTMTNEENVNTITTDSSKDSGSEEKQNFRNTINVSKKIKQKGKAVHFTVKCDGCGQFPLIGNRYKCKTCPNFDYCETCHEKMKEQHCHEFNKIEKPFGHHYHHFHMGKKFWPHKFMKTEQSEDKKENKPIHFGWICDGCEMNPIIGNRYKCKTCPNFDFCETCYEKMKEQHGHEFIKMEKPQYIAPPFEKAFPFKIPGWSLKFQTASSSPKKNEKEEQKKEELPIHYCVKCDGCGQFPIIGNRYKCKTCGNFDFCESCYEKKQKEHGHEFNIIEKPKNAFRPLLKRVIKKLPPNTLEHLGLIKRPKNFDSPRKELLRNTLRNVHHLHKIEKTQESEKKNEVKLNRTMTQKNIHFGVQCDGCGVYPIIGCRYKCVFCDNFDYCEECEKKLAIEHGHPLIKITDPKMSPMIKKITKNGKK